MAISFLLAACDTTEVSPSAQDPEFTVTNNLNERIEGHSSPSKSEAPGSREIQSYSVQGVATVQAPEIKNNQTVASSLSFNSDNGKQVFVGYKIPGTEYGGGIDVINADDPRRLRQVNSYKSTNLDVQEIANDADEDAEYIAGAVKTETTDSPAAIVTLDLQNGDGSNVRANSRRLSGNVAKSVVPAPESDSKHDMYVVTDGNSIYRLNAELRDQLRQQVEGVEFSSITVSQSMLIMLTKSGEMWKSDFGSASKPWKNGLSFESSQISPLGIARIQTGRHNSAGNTFIFSALNKGGFRIVDSDADQRFYKKTEGHYTSVSSTQKSDYLYASRANGTVEVYGFDANNSPSWGDIPIKTIDVSEYPNISNSAQVNQALSTGQYLYIATSDGLLVLKVNR